MLHRMRVVAGIVSTLMFMSSAVAHDYAVQRHEQKYHRLSALERSIVARCKTLGLSQT